MGGGGRRQRQAGVLTAGPVSPSLSLSSCAIVYGDVSGSETAAERLCSEGPEDRLLSVPSLLRKAIFVPYFILLLTRSTP